MDLKDQQTKFEMTLEALVAKNKNEIWQKEESFNVYKETLERHKQNLENQLHKQKEMVESLQSKVKDLMEENN